MGADVKQIYADGMSRLYTKTGDDGSTGLRSEERCNKADPRIEAEGAIDELNSALGVALAAVDNRHYSSSADYQSALIEVQGDLFHIGALLSGEKRDADKRAAYLEKRVGELEKGIDKIQKGLPKQTKFYLPGGSQVAARLDFARAVARRAERRVVALSGMEESVLKYINRLSDYLYALARWMNQTERVKEKKWTNNLRL